MTRDAAFWRNFSLIVGFHAAVIVGVVLWSANTRKPIGSGIVWMERGVEQLASPQLQVSDSAAEEQDEEEEPTIETRHERQLTKESAAPRATPKKAASIAKPKKVVAKKAVRPTNKTVAKQAEHSKKSASTSGTGNRDSGAGNPSQFSWYGNMLHDRFFSSWEQPTSVVATGARISVLVRLRIEKDGRVSSFALVRPSGNVVVDQSVAAVGKRVTQVDPLPTGLGSGDHYDVNINFELNAD